MKLCFYSGGTANDNLKLDKAVLDLAPSNPRITYIPSCSYFCEDDFQDFLKHYTKFGIYNIIKFSIDAPVTQTLLHEVLQSDIIHLSGGNTFYFLKNLREKNMLSELNKFVKRGGILTGLSAGGILMTNNISLAAIPSFDRDDNDDNIKNLKSMNLVDFEFFPHYINSKRYDQELLEYSNTLSRPIYACPDGSGLVVSDEKIDFINKVFCFYEGHKFKVT